MAQSPSAFDLTRDLVRFDTINPPGNETGAAFAVGKILEAAGFRVAYHSFASHRDSLIADLDGSDNSKPLCFTGHLDTVPLGAMPWSKDPFTGETSDGKLFGRGTSDMKSGIAAMVLAAIDVARRPRRGGLKLVLTAAEETGCEGAQFLAKTGVLGQAGAMVVGEPSSNRPFIGHRGALWLKLIHHGKTAHGSMPELGDNAVIKAAHTIRALDDFGFNIEPHKHLGKPSLNIGYVHGGVNVNSVPDRAEVGLDFRTIPAQSHDHICAAVAARARPGTQLERSIDLEGVFSDPSGEWLTSVFGTVERVTGRKPAEETAPYVTDAAVLGPAYGNPPFVILGPGEKDMAHQTDEYCVVERIEEAVEIYRAIASDWCEGRRR
jgi:succinyl-diaminopimelate desuccinylase